MNSYISWNFLFFYYLSFISPQMIIIIIPSSKVPELYSLHCNLQNTSKLNSILFKIKTLNKFAIEGICLHRIEGIYES
jgi:hypothetical protein